MSDKKVYDSEYSAWQALAGGGNFDSTYSAMKAVLDGGEKFDSPYSIVTDFADDVEAGDKSISKETDLSVNITENGVYNYTPEEGYVYGSVEISVDAGSSPTEKLVETITENGVYNYTGEYKDAEITVEVEGGGVEGTVEITTNGSYNVAPYEFANVNVQTSENYSYKVGAADVEGLRAIGWDDASIGYFRDNNLGYPWQSGDFTVSEENKALYGVVNAGSSMSTIENMEYCPMFDTSSVTNIQQKFYGCSNLKAIPLLDTSNVTDMYEMFKECSSLITIPPLDTSNVTRMLNVFNKCSSLITIPPLDTSNVTDMQMMFANCSNLKTIPQLDTSNVIIMQMMFTGCSNLKTIPQLDTSNVTNMEKMFNSCSNLQELPGFNWVKIERFGSASYSTWLYGCSALRKLGVVSCDSVTNINYFFSSTMSALTDFGGCRNLGMVEGLTGTDGSYFLNYAPNLTYESVKNVLNELYDRTSAGYSVLTLKLHSNHLSQLTEDDIAIATNKGWTLV